MYDNGHCTSDMQPGSHRGGNVRGLSPNISGFRFPHKTSDILFTVKHECPRT